VPTTEENYEIGKQLLNKINSGQTTWLGKPIMREQFQVHEKPPESFRATQPTDASDEDVQRAWDRKVLSEKFRPKSATPQMQKRSTEMIREKAFEGTAPIAPPVSE
jgi:hypothetical protein